MPGLGRRTRSDESRLMLWLERPRLRGAPDLLLAPIHATGAGEDQTYEYLKLIEKRKSEFEAGRCSTWRRRGPSRNCTCWDTTAATRRTGQPC